MMFSYRLVRLIESHADALAAGLEKRALTSLQVPHFKHVPAHELRERVYEIYRHLGEWRCWARTNWISSTAIAKSGLAVRARTFRSAR